MKNFLVALSMMFVAAQSAMADPQSNAGPGSSISFQGEVFVTAVSGTCTGTAAVGDNYRLIYRHKEVSTDLADAIAMYGTRMTYIFGSLSDAGSLNGPTPTNNAIITSHAEIYGGIDGSSNLVVTTFGGAPIETSGNLRITGTIDSFFATKGCSATIRASLTKRD